MNPRISAAAAAHSETDTDDPVWAAIQRAPVREETPEERAAFDAAVAAGGEHLDGAEVSAELARCRDAWPDHAGK